MNYENKNITYFKNIRTDLLQLLPKFDKPVKVLEIGASYGETLFYLKENNIASECVGVDIFEDKENQDRYKKIDQFIFGNIEEIVITNYDNYFDVLLLPDVLEHLHDPKNALLKLKKSLKPSAIVLVSMPNIQHYSALKKIFFKGDFSYEESGIFDYTHVRFYCKKNILELIESAGFKIQKAESSITNYKGKSFAKLINTCTFGLFEPFFSYQYFIKASL